MPEDLHESWRAAIRAKPRIAFLHVLTGQKPNNLCHQTEVIEREIETWVKATGLDIDRVYAAREASIADEQKYNHRSGDLWRMWIRTMVLCDIVLVHAHQNGSSALGEFLAKAANAAHAPSVVIIVPEGTPVSKAWRGQFDHYTNVRFVDVQGQGEDLIYRLMLAVKDILDSRMAYIVDGPSRRADVEMSIEPMAVQLRRYWSLAPRDVRVTVSRKMGLSEEHMQEHVEDSSLLANLGLVKALKSIQMLVPPADLVIETGRKNLSAKTMNAWAVWSDDDAVEFEFAVWQLRRAIEAKNYADMGVSQPLDLTEPALWELFAGRGDDLS